MHTATRNGEKLFWKRLGIVGFMFFLGKGLVWLAVPFVMYWMGVVGR